MTTRRGRRTSASVVAGERSTRERAVPTEPLPPEVGERIGPYYVYVLVDPRDDSIFYVGKGTRQRLLAHVDEAQLEGDPDTPSAKDAAIKEIRDAGLKPRIDVVRHGLRSEEQAFHVEGALIDCLDNLTNVIKSPGTEQGRSSLTELTWRYGATPIDDSAPPAICVRLGAWKNEREQLEPGTFREGHGFREGMTPQQLAESGRAWWPQISPTGAQQRGIRHAVVVHQGITRAVMEIGDWTRRGNRWAFSATPLTEGPVYDAWVGPLGKRVKFRQGNRKPAVYWPFK